MNNKDVKINKQAKEYLLNYLQGWIDELSKFPFSYRKGIVRAIYAKIDDMPVYSDSKEFARECKECPMCTDCPNNCPVERS